MARGVTEIDVHQAADELALQGERPTVDRIRSHLGTGSPNTVTRWLDTWWRSLGRRLSAQDKAMAMEQAPEAVARLAQQMWEQALAAAQTSVTAGLAEQHAQVELQREKMNQEKVQWQHSVAHSTQAAEQAEAAAAGAIAELGHLKSLVERQDAQIADLVAQRDTAERARDHLTAQLSDAVASHQRDMSAAQAERQALRTHLQGLEDRSLLEVDRARQEAKQANLDLSTKTKELQGEIRTLRQREEAARKSAAKQDVELAALRARLQAATLRTVGEGAKALPRKRVAAETKARAPRASRSKP